MSAPSTTHGASGGNDTPPELSSEQVAAINRELQAIIESDEFRTSPRCQEFLRYIVEHSLRSPNEPIKERNIGIDIFHRSPGYEPNSDSIVRVRATEVRKRLAQHYGKRTSPPEVRIVLATGSYVPEFRFGSAATGETTPAPAPPVRSYRAIIAAILIIASAAAVLWWQIHPRPTALYDFWKPALASPNPIVICMGQPVVYHLSRRVHENFLKTQPKDRTPGPYVIPLKPGDVTAEDILPVPDQYVGAGSAQAAARLSALFSGWRKPVQIRIGNDLSSYDLRNHPAVLEGAFSNDWAMKLTADMPFVFIQDGTLRGIREPKADPPKTWYLRSLDGAGKTTEDYALVSRVLESDTMEPLVFIAGVTQYGTQAAGELVADEVAFQNAIASVPGDWRTHNLQILVHLRVIGRIPGKPEVLAVRTW